MTESAVAPAVAPGAPEDGSEPPVWDVGVGVTGGIGCVRMGARGPFVGSGSGCGCALGALVGSGAAVTVGEGVGVGVRLGTG